MNTLVASTMLRTIADLNATAIGVLEGLNPELVMSDLDEAEAKLRKLRFDLFRGNIQYDCAE
jgi:hypothetical protein